MPQERQEDRKRRGKKSGFKAWLITWEHCGDHAKPPRRIAAILNPRLGAQRVVQIVELLYANESYTLSERIGFMKSPDSVPYKAEFGSLISGVPWEGQICCGHNPFLEARLVDNLHVECDQWGNETPRWTERPKPNVEWLRKQRREG